MSRRAPPPPGYFEEDDFDVDREKYTRSRRPERSYEEEVEYHRRRSVPPVEDMERMRIRDRPPQEFVRETFIVPPRKPQPPVRMRRSVEEVVPLPEPGDDSPPPRARRRGRRVRDIDEEELVMDEREVRGGRRYRPREVDEELIIDEQERRGGRNPRGQREIDEEEMAIRRGGRMPPFDYDSESESRPRERRFSDVRDEVFVRSSDSRRKPRQREVEFEEDLVDDRREIPRRSKRGAEPPASVSMSKEEERIMRWKDQPSPRELEEDEELRVRSMRRRDRRSPPQPQYDRGPPGAWPEERDEDVRVEIKEEIPSRMRSRPEIDETDNYEEVDIRRERYGRNRRRRSTDSEEIIHESRRRSIPQERALSPQPKRAPPIHQDIITHHRHIDHGYDDSPLPRAPSPGKESTVSSIDEARINHRSQRHGHRSEENIIFKRRDEEESVSPTSCGSAGVRNPRKTDDRRSRKARSLGRESDTVAVESPKIRSRRGPRREVEEVVEEEDIDIRLKRSTKPSIVNDVKRDSAEEWSVVHAPSKEEAIEMTGALDVVEVAPRDASSVDGSESEEEVEVQRNSRVKPEVSKERRDERWTEITKDLVVRDAIERMGYEFEETRMFYYIFSYLESSDIDELVELSDEIRRARRRRIREMHREREYMPARSASLVDRMPHRPRLGGERRVRERGWIIESHR